ncbi:MscL family protein [Mycoplasma tauri]|uniref:MscL family protein n=1 Tax=Mycoplasma tauri TaxID=547987 RepID=UPI001CBB4EF1|nr:MscL family protein [Mycoplasma tauri]MBZ4203717.1 MscL family protein [Mycoplasma tauri]
MFKKAVADSWASVKRGNMLMLAIGLLLGTSFNEVIKSLANDVIMSAIAHTFKVNDVAKLTAGPVLIGKFLAALISFIIVSALVFVFLVVIFYFRALYLSKHPKPVKKEEPKIEEKILDELKKLNENFKNLKERD